MTQRFVDTFLKGLELEMDSVKEQVEELVIRLGQGKKQDDGYLFSCQRGLERLSLGQTGTLINSNGGPRIPVTVEELGERDLLLKSEVTFDPGGGDYGLEVVPWFLFEKMQKELNRLTSKEHPYHPEMALRTFGKLPAENLAEQAPVEPHPELNPAQNLAVDRGVNRQLSFLWGPPGTGKTTTLARLLHQLLERNRRVLVVSNTNTAIDQVLDKLKRLPETAPLAAEGRLLRLGTTEPDEPCALGNVIKVVYRTLVEELSALQQERNQASDRLRKIGPALEKLRAQVEPEQLDLFADAGPGLSSRELREILSGDTFDRVLELPAKEQMEHLESYKETLEAERQQARERIKELRQTLKESGEAIVAQARVVFSTLASLTVHPLLEERTFDTVIIEEAGMAILPAVFLAAARASQQVVVVGDPRQLPSILSSRHASARKILGRSIFEVTVPEPETSELVSMLDTQYRMCPEIGDLVSGLFYGGNLKTADSTSNLAEKTAREPFPGRGVLVIDLAGKSRCERPPNSRSRFNEESARVAVAIVRKGLADGVESMAVITPYREQVRTIERMLAEEALDLSRVTCSTVHRFQGHEREVVVVDTVDAPPMEPGVLLCDRNPNSASAQLLNVSISRAQAKLILLAELRYLVSRQTGVLGELLRQAVAGGQVVRVALQNKVEPKAPVGGTGTRSDWD